MIEVKEIKRTRESIPFNAADQQLVPIHLDLYGYEEKEYFYSGLSNVYGLKGERVEIQSEDAPYKNRFILRKPIGKCSGNVVFEILNSTNGWDVAPMWSLLWKKILRDHDIYIGVTSRAVSVRSLKQFNSVRYGELSWKNPNPLSGDINRDILMWQHSSKEDEDGLVWDMVAQLSNYLKSDIGQDQLQIQVNHIYATGCSQSAMLLTTFMTQFDEIDQESYIASNFDGYLTYSGCRMLSLNQEQAPCPLKITRNVRVPVMRFMSQWDFKDFAGDLRLRREDSDLIEDRFRLYEIAGQAHASYAGAFYRPGQLEMTKLGKNAELPPLNISPLPLDAFICQGLENLKQWVQKNIAPPCCQRIEVNEEGNECFDMYGNCKGGLRYPHLDVPYATYYSGTLNNPQEGYYVPFTDEKLKQIYKTRMNYVSSIFEKIDGMYKEKWISFADAESMKEEFLRLPIFKEEKF